MRDKGFTLIELMLVVAIIGLLAAIAIPKFGNMVIKAKEAAVKGHLGSLRSALTLYYADNEGRYPSPNFPNPPVNFFNGTLTTKYISEIPMISIPTATEHIALMDHCAQALGPIEDWQNGACGSITAYGYFWPEGRIAVTCTHADSRGTIWSVH